jgi:hypothetical protein
MSSVRVVLQPDVLDLLVGDHDVVALLDLVALDDIRPLDRPRLRIGGIILIRFLVVLCSMLKLTSDVRCVAV